MKNLCLVLPLFFCIRLAAAPVPEDLELEAELISLKAQSAGTPAEWMGKRVSSPDFRLIRATLLEQRHGEPGETQRKLRQLRDAIRLGLEWKKPQTVYEIPYASLPPAADGVLSPGEWENALIFIGEYPSGSREPGDRRTEWRFLYDRDRLYWSAKFFGPEPRAAPTPYLGDSLELFVRGDLRLREYREIVIDCSGAVHAAWNVTDRRLGLYENDIGPCPDLEFHVSLFPGGWQAEASLPWGEIPGYLPGGKAAPGAVLALMPVQTVPVAPGLAGLSAPVPMLYDGHNTDGHMTMKLGPVPLPERSEDDRKPAAPQDFRQFQETGR